MKKILTLLTGIVFVITILVAGGCGNGKKQNDSTEVKKGLISDEDDSTRGHIYLKDSVIDGKTHLFMYDKQSECGVIDDHLIVVKRNHTVKWKNANDSKITEILHIRAVGADTTFFGASPVIDTEEVDSTEVFSINKGVFKLVIPDSATLNTLVKYEIIFTVEDDTTKHIIDPYLKIPDEEEN